MEQKIALACAYAVIEYINTMTEDDAFDLDDFTNQIAQIIELTAISAIVAELEAMRANGR